VEKTTSEITKQSVTTVQKIGVDNAYNPDMRYRSQQSLATGYEGQPPESPNPGGANGKQALYDWAASAFYWEAVTTSSGDLRREIKTGKSLANGAAEQGGSSHPDWDLDVSSGGVQIWDKRPYGFNN
jgi:hypothetical protein